MYKLGINHERDVKPFCSPDVFNKCVTYASIFCKWEAKVAVNPIISFV